MVLTPILHVPDRAARDAVIEELNKRGYKPTSFLDRDDPCLVVYPGAPTRVDICQLSSARDVAGRRNTSYTMLNSPRHLYHYLAQHMPIKPV